MDLRVMKVNRKNRKAVKKIYYSSFPKEERMPFWLMLLMAKLWHTDFVAFDDGDTVCGFVYMGTAKKLVFIMFFAVDEHMRSKGYGSRILDKIQSMYPERKIVISIERCDIKAQDIDQRIKRKNFYVKNGYEETGHLVRLAGVEQEIIIKNGTFKKNEFLWFFIKYSNGTMYPKIWLKKE